MLPLASVDERVRATRNVAKKFAKAAKKVDAPRQLVQRLYAYKIWSHYKRFSMVPRDGYITNLLLCMNRISTRGCIVECGVWRGGMSAGIADVLPGRVHYLFDSFEGLPPAKDIDGPAAAAWQSDKLGATYYDNCRAERSFAERAMAISGAKEFHLVQGWFSDTVPGFVPSEPIAVLRLDADWYDSTAQCLSGLYPHVMEGGLVIVDDYYLWDGCSRAVHDYFSEHQLADRIELLRGVCYFIKRGEPSQPPAAQLRR